MSKVLFIVMSLFSVPHYEATPGTLTVNVALYEHVTILQGVITHKKGSVWL